MNSLSPKSPCVAVCSIGPKGWCRGCYRTLEEITGWSRMTADARWEVIRATESRRSVSPPEDLSTLFPK